MIIIYDTYTLYRLELITLNIVIKNDLYFFIDFAILIIEWNGNMYQKLKQIFTEKSNVFLDKKDWMILGIVVLIYGILSFWNLGSTINPTSFVYKESNNDVLVYEITGRATGSIELRYFTGPEQGEYMILGSTDNKNYEMLGKTETDAYVLSWYDVTLNPLDDIKYLKLVPTGTNSSMGEIALKNKHLSLNALNEKSKLLIDEPDIVPDKISYMNSTYFDEVYFARTAYQYANDMPAYEWVHPPFGKLVQSIPIRLFGMSPFSYRLVSNLAGILLIVVMYAFGKALFKKRGYALTAALIMALDGFHFAQTRIGTIDSQLTLYILSSYYFMYRYLLLGRKESIKKKLWYLCLSGITIACAIATKWTGLFAGLGLAILFFTGLWFTYRKKKLEKQDKKTIGIIIGSCVIFFVIIPITLYFSCYFLFPNVNIFHVTNMKELVNITNQVYTYHSTLDATHPFSSDWYSWPIMWKPVWFYSGEVVDGIRGTISSVGNPIIWWTSILGIIGSFIMTLKKDKRAIVLCVAFICMFLPYLKIGRCMFLYHYFPVLPFVMLMLVYGLSKLTEKTKCMWIIPVFLGITLILFILFYPVVSGLPVSETWIHSLQWLPEWYF